MADINQKLTAVLFHEHVTKGKKKKTKFCLVASGSGSWFCACWLSVTLSWLTGTLE